MSTHVLRPSADGASSGVTVLPAWSKLNDNSDATFVDFAAGSGSSIYLSVTNYTLGNEVIRRIRHRMKADAGALTSWFQLRDEVTGKNHTLSSFSPVATGVTNEYASSWIYGADGGNSWTQEDLNNLGLRIRYGSMRVYEVYVDVETYDAPVTTITGPTGTSTEDVQPNVTGSITDAYGDDLEAFEIRVFTDGQYLAGGFNVETTTPYWTSGEVISSDGGIAIDHQIGIDLPNDTYRAYLRARTDKMAWSAWVYSTFTVSVLDFLFPTITATADNSDNSVQVTISEFDNLLNAENADFESGGASDWTGVVNCTATPGAYGIYALTGGRSLRMTPTGAGTMAAGLPTGLLAEPVTPGAQYQARGQVRQPGATTRTARVHVYWYKADGTPSVTPSTQAASGNSTNSNFTAISGTVTAPADAAFARLYLEIVSAGAAENHYWDSLGIMPLPNTFWKRGITENALRSFELWRSDNGGDFVKLDMSKYSPVDLDAITWQNVNNSITLKDYSAPRGVPLIYRARTKAVAPSGSTLYSPFASSSTVSITASGWFLKSPTDPTKSIALTVLRGLSIVDNIDSTDYTPIDSDEVIRKYGRSRGDRIRFVGLFKNAAAWTAFKTLRETKKTLLLQASDGRQWWVTIGGNIEAAEDKFTSGVERKPPLDFQEVNY